MRRCKSRPVVVAVMSLMFCAIGEAQPAGQKLRTLKFQPQVTERDFVEIVPSLLGLKHLLPIDPTSDGYGSLLKEKDIIPPDFVITPDEPATKGKAPVPLAGCSQTTPASQPAAPATTPHSEHPETQPLPDHQPPSEYSSSPPPPQEESLPLPREGPPPVYVPPAPPQVTLLKINVQSEIPGGNQRAVDSFLQTYPFLVKYLGEPFSIGADGVNWKYDANATSWGWDARTNTVLLGPNILEQPPDQPPYAKLDEAYQHETTHLFYDVGDNIIHFTFGQWIWEAHALAGQALANQDALGFPAFGLVVAYDTEANIGYEVLNGVPRDGEKWNRTIVDGNATSALLLLVDVLSAESDRDFLKRVNAGILDQYRTTRNVDISAEAYRAILNKAAAGKKIDGQSPGDWLFSQPVANIAGKVGDYLAIVPLYSAEWYGMELFPTRFWVFAFRRERRGRDFRETTLEGLDVKLTVYNAVGEVMRQTTVQSTGGIGVELDVWEILPEDINDGAYLVKAEANADGKLLEAYNYFVIMRQAPKVTIEDDRLIVVLTNASGSGLVSKIPTGMTVTGGQISATLPGILVVNAKPGVSVTFEMGSFVKTISKPLTARVVPLRLP